MMFDKLFKRMNRLSSALDRGFGLLSYGSGVQSQTGQTADRTLNPQGIFEWASTPSDTINVMDVSGSMGEKDCYPSRLEASKTAVEAFRAKRACLSPGDRIGLVAFTWSAKIVLPLTPILQAGSINISLATLRAGGGTVITAGLKAAEEMFAEDALPFSHANRFQRVLLLTDGDGGRPLESAKCLKNRGVLIEVIGFGGRPADVNERLLRKVATTDSNGFTHYWFFRDTDSLIAHYEDLATGIVFRSPEK